MLEKILIEAVGSVPALVIVSVLAWKVLGFIGNQTKLTNEVHVQINAANNTTQFQIAEGDRKAHDKSTKVIEDTKLVIGKNTEVLRQNAVALEKLNGHVSGQHKPVT